MPQATALHALVLAHQARGERKEALQVAEEAADIYKAHGSKETFSLASGDWREGRA